jgi:hypothetical protein
MEGRREMFRCGSCGKSFSYWVPTATEHPKVKCYFCGVELFPKGEPPAAPAPAAAAPEPKPA